MSIVQQTQRELDHTEELAKKFDDSLKRLASLTPIQYDRVREAEAKLLGVRVATLDIEVKKLQAETPTDTGNGAAVLFADPAPWPVAVDGAEVLDELVTTLQTFIVLPDGAAEAAALWLLHAHAHAAFRVSAVLAITSPEKRCGKTTALALLQRLTPRPLPAANITAAALFRAVEKWRPTLLIDEADTFLRDSDELRGVLNSGHTRDGACVIRTVGDDHEPRAFSTWAPKAIALIGKLPATLHDRAIEVRLARKLPGELVDRLRTDRAGFEDLRRRCARWAKDHADTLRNTDPRVPGGLHDRAADNWMPLLSIADLAGGTWPARARRAAIEMSSSDDGDEAAGAVLLEDLQALFMERGERLMSTEIVDVLGRMEERPWPEWRHGHPLTVRQLARLLRPFGIHPRTIRAGTDRAKGYEVGQFVDAFARYLPSLLSIRDTVTNPENKAISENAIRDTEKLVTDGNREKPLENKVCHGVTDQNPRGKVRL